MALKDTVNRVSALSDDQLNALIFSVPALNDDINNYSNYSKEDREFADIVMSVRATRELRDKDLYELMKSDDECVRLCAAAEVQRRLSR